MAHAVPIPPPGFDGLSPDEKIRYVQDFWDYIAANTATVLIPDWHRRVLDERLADDHADPHEGEPCHRFVTDCCES
jgi:putative addiction module component (TIGR02574 family)